MLIRWTHADHASDAGRGAHGGFGVVAAESRMRETDAHRAIHGDDQTLRLKVRFGENKTFQGRPVPKLHTAATEKRLIPNLNQPWRIVVAKISVLDHEANPSVVILSV